MGKWLNGAREVRAAMDAAGAQLDDAAALDAMAIYPVWEIGAAYATNDRRRYGANLYKCVQAHTSQADWTPDAVPALFAKVLIPDETIIPEWVQPDSTNPYRKGDKVTHNGNTWISDIDNNVWEPGVYGWEIT